jgi:hypothetical protein
MRPGLGLSADTTMTKTSWVSVCIDRVPLRAHAVAPARIPPDAVNTVFHANPLTDGEIG